MNSRGKMSSQKTLRIFGILFLLLTISLTVTAEVKVSRRVTESLTNGSTIEVIVKLRDVDDSSVKRNEFIDAEKISKKNRRNLQKVLTDYSSSHIRTKGSSYTGLWFSGNLSSEGLSKLRNDERIREIIYDYRVYPTLDNASIQVNSSYPWSLNYTGKGQRICVIDSGVDYSHFNLGNCSEVGDGCPIVDGWDRIDSDDDPEDTQGHGTAIAGIILSNHSNWKGIAYGSEIVAMKIYDDVTAPLISDIGLAIEDCVLPPYNSTIITISIVKNGTFYEPGTCNNTIKESIDWAYDHGAFITVSSGNKGNITGIEYPACEPNVTSVGAVYRRGTGTYNGSCYDANAEDDEITCFTNRAGNLDLLAPGSLITTTYLYQTFHQKSGTSYATPIVAAGAAILREINPDFTPDQLRYILSQTGKPIVDSGGSGLTFPRIDLYNATLTALRSEILEVENTGTANLSVSNINSSESWIIDITPTSFTLTPNTSKEVLITVDEDQIEIGTETGEVEIHSNDPDESVKAINVILKKIKEGCGVGVCPPGSGDWVVDEYTAVWLNDTHTDGDVDIQSGATLFLGELESNVTGILEFTDGELKLDDSEIIFL